MNQELLGTISFYIDIFNPFSNQFSEDVSSHVLIDDSQNIKELSHLINQSLTKRINNSILLYGQTGYGRKSAIRKAIHNYEKQSKQKQVIKIFVNAFLHSSESNILQAIQNQLSIITDKKQTAITKLQVPDLINYFSQFESQFSGMILVIDKVEILATVKKQFFLYSILEWIRESSFPVVFVGITTDLLFQEKLEKRVKSRFQNTPFFFMELDFKFAQKLLLNRIDQIDRNSIVNIYEDYVKSQAFEQYFIRLTKLQLSYSKLIYLFRLSIDIAIAYFEKIQNSISIQELMEESEKYIFPNLKYQIAKNLNQPEFVILFSLYNLIIQQKPQILFDDIIQHSEKARQVYNLQRHITISEFTPQVLNKALDNLIKLNLITLQFPQTKNLENNQIVLAVPIDDVKELIEYGQDNLNDYICYLTKFGI